MTGQRLTAEELRDIQAHIALSAHGNPTVGRLLSHIEAEKESLSATLAAVAKALEIIAQHSVINLADGVKRCTSCGMEWTAALYPDGKEFHSPECPAQLAKAALAAVRSVGVTATRGRTE